MKLCVVAGEASGDLHAAGVVRELRTLDPSLEVFGFGGDLLEAEGVRVLHHVRELGIVGLFNVIRHLGMFRVVFGELLAEIRRQKPDVVLLVDYPDFNLRIAAKVKAMGIPVVYFISPQVWAWRKRRIHAIARNVDHMLVLFPFEVDLYRRYGVEATYVGHPLLEQLEHVQREDRVPDGTSPVRIALMPGSRRMEIEALLPDMLDAVSLMSRSRPVDAFIIRAPTISEESIVNTLQEKGLELRVVKQDGGRSLAAADIALSSSGTATLEAAIIGVPVVVMYRLNRPTFALARLLVDLPHFSLVNIVAGKQIVPELVQKRVNGVQIAEAAEDLLRPKRYREVVGELRRVRELLGETGSSMRAAEKIYKLVRERETGSPTPDS